MTPSNDLSAKLRSGVAAPLSGLAERVECAECGGTSKLLDTRLSGAGARAYRWRRWHCLSCGTRFTTTHSDTAARLVSPPRRRLICDADIRSILTSTDPVRALAKRYNCSFALISQIQTGRRYADAAPDLPRRLAKPPQPPKPRRSAKPLERRCINCASSAGLSGCLLALPGPAQLCPSFTPAP